MDEEKLSENVKTFKEKLKGMPIQMRAFSLSLRSLYVEKAVGSQDEPAVKFRKLRDDTRNDAMVYLKCLLPLTTHFVRSIKEFFEYFEVLNFEEWKESLSDIKDETIAYKGVCEALLKGHEEILVPLKQRKDQATIVLGEFENLQKKYEEQIEKLQADIESPDGNPLNVLLFPLMLVPVVNVIVHTLLKGGAAKRIAEKAAAETQVETNASAALVVENALIPAIEHFIEGLSCAAGFFSIMQQDLQTFEDKASHEHPKKLHYKVMSKEAEEMKGLCQEFFAVLPAVRTDFQAIPTEGTDQNYVDKWLEKQKKIIEEKCKVKNIVFGMLKSLTDAAETDKEE